MKSSSLSGGWLIGRTIAHPVFARWPAKYARITMKTRCTHRDIRIPPRSSYEGLGWISSFRGLLAAQAPDCAIAPGFTQTGEAREFNTDTLFNYMDGNSEGYFLYSFVRMQGVTCKQGELSLVLDVSEFADPEMAYGMFTANFDNRRPRTALGAGGQVGPTKAIFVKGKYFVELSVEPEGEHAALLEAAARAMERRVPGSVSVPPQLSLFPKEGLQPGSPRLIPHSVLGLRMLEKGYLGIYDNGRLFFVTEASPDAAQALLAKLKARFPACRRDATELATIPTAARTAC